MNLTTAGLLLGALLLSTTNMVPAATAQTGGDNATVSRGPVPDWVVESTDMPVPDDATGLFFMRRQDTLVHLTKDGQSNFVSQKLRILRSQALEAGNISIAWNPDAGAPTVHRLLVHRNGQAIDVLEKTDFEILRREDQLEQAMLDGILTAVLRVPDLRVGDDLELAWTAPGHDPTLGNLSYGMLLLADAPAEGRLRLGLSWNEGQKPYLQLADSLSAITEQSTNSLDIRADNLETLVHPKDAPARFAWGRIAEFSDFKTWGAVSRRFDPIFSEAAQLAPDSPIKEEAARIAAAYGNDLERAQAALDFVQQQVRYVYVGLNGGNFTPASADTTWERRYGDCKGKTILLMAMLDEMGIEAQPVLVSNAGADDGLNERLPTPGLFDHVLVRAYIDGESYWMDGTMPEVVIADVDPIIPYRWVLPISASGSELEAVEQKPFALPQEMGLYDIDASAGFDQPARKTTVNVTRGIDGIVEYMQFTSISKAQLEEAMRNALAGETGWNEIEKVDYRYDRETKASILTIVGTGPVDWEDEGADAYSVFLPGGGFIPPGRRQRASSQDQEAPFYTKPTYSCYATTLRIPETTDIDNWSFNSTFDTAMYGRLYYRMMDRRDDGTIRLVRGARVEDPEITPERAARDNRRLDDFDNSKAYVYYDPDEKAPLVGYDLRPVPAIDEIDWTGPTVPCLPEDVLNEAE